jgi:hypothetical protein
MFGLTSSQPRSPAAFKTLSTLSKAFAQFSRFVPTPLAREFGHVPNDDNLGVVTQITVFLASSWLVDVFKG